MVEPYRITGAAIANCLGSDNASVFANAFSGASTFRDAAEFAEFPFATVLGIMPKLEEYGGLDCTPTRVANIAFASVRQLRSAVAAAVTRWGPARVGYVFASSTGGLEQTEARLNPRRDDSNSRVRYDDHGIDATMPAIARYFGLAGICMAISTACSSSLNALVSATRLLDRRLADAVVVGSADSLCRTTVFGFHSLGLLATTATQPFARDRAGLTLGEGSAYVLLERAAVDATGGELGYVMGVGAATDAYHHTTPHPQGLAGQRCMQNALQRAGLSADQIDCVSAHGTGTKLNDAAEAAALNHVFGRRVAVTATKSLTGHTLGSAGLTALVLALESLRRQEISPTLRLQPVDSALGVEVVGKPTPTRLDHIVVNAFGFGGNNVSVVVSHPRQR